MPVLPSRILIALLLAGPLLADTRIISWEPATHDTAGNLLPVGYVWTAVSQYRAGCPAIGVPSAGKAVPALPGIVQQASFEVPAGQCSCLVAVTWVWTAPVGQYLSEPVESNACTEARACTGCH